jgi:hypothetical protein
VGWVPCAGARRVSNRFGGIDQDVIAAFYSLSNDKLTQLLKLYANQYGSGPADYAAHAYAEWRSGRKQMAGQTLERLIEVVPLVLSFEQKLELYKKRRSKLRPQERVTVTVTGEQDIHLVEEAAWRIVKRAETQPLPSFVDARLTWLSQGDGLLARELVAAIERQDGERTATAIAQEVRDLHNVFAESSILKVAEHVIDLPCGVITVGFKRQSRFWRWFMSDDNQTGAANLPTRRDDTRIVPAAKDIIDAALQQGASEEIVLAAQREAVRLATKVREGQIDAANAQKELQDSIDQAEQVTRL